MTFAWLCIGIGIGAFLGYQIGFGRGYRSCWQEDKSLIKGGKEGAE